MRHALLFAAIGTCIACLALSCRGATATGSGADGGITPAPGGGVCCPYDEYTGCEGARRGGWAPNADACSNQSDGIDLYLTPGKDDHGCPFLVEAPCGCGCCGHPLCPSPDAAPTCPAFSAATGSPAGDCQPTLTDLKNWCGNAACNPSLPPYEYGCNGGEPGASLECVQFDGTGVFCCKQAECVRSASLDSFCSAVGGVYYFCPILDAGVVQGPGTCTPMEPPNDLAQQQRFCCK